MARDKDKDSTIGGDGKDVWVFDIDETTLFNLPYYARSDVAFGAIPFNNAKFNEWVSEGKAPAIPATLRLYKMVLSLGIKPVFITGTPRFTRKARIANLKKAGYTSWLKLVLKGKNDSPKSVVFKSSKRTELVKAGYRIVGNIGDQWSDLIGDNVGSRTFKVPDPMYYIG
uniref:Acid phosphatase 1-like n=1 Tax=Nicotiana tabacum TaxID=4097 RepID=A0A1S3XV55_TOBAC|nr:PREDICTED: acid phosphatase 1-like [Nicotiana tabacum]